MNFAASSPTDNHPASMTWVNWERCCNVLLAMLFFRFVLLNLQDLSIALRLSTILMLIKVSADTLFYLTRRPAQQISTSVYDWIIGIFGAYTNFFFISTTGSDVWWATSIQLVGLALQVGGILSLNRSIGYVAANRGIRTTGMYRFVRHPLYFAYCVSFLGYLLNHFTTHNLVIYAAMVTGLFLRILAEERLLSQDSEYRSYMNRVRCRLLPGLI